MSCTKERWEYLMGASGPFTGLKHSEASSGRSPTRSPPRRSRTPRRSQRRSPRRSRSRGDPNNFVIGCSWQRFFFWLQIPLTSISNLLMGVGFWWFHDAWKEVKKCYRLGIIRPGHRKKKRLALILDPRSQGQEPKPQPEAGHHPKIPMGF